MMRNVMKEWLEGHITIVIRGKRFERLLNMAVREGIYIWNIRRGEGERAQCDILIRDFFRLRPLLRETGCRVSVVRRDGLPFWLIRLRMRAGFALGAFLFLVGLYMLSSFVWNIEVQGTRALSPYEVRLAAAKVGIKEGAWKAKLKEPQALQREMLSLLPEASWVGVEIHGTKAIIQVVERDRQEVAESAGPRHLVAKKKAVVHSIVAEAGKSVVKVNQYVEQGQVLISGVIGNEERQALVTARGKVKGEVWYVSQVTIPLTQKRYHLTGEKQEQHHLVLGPFAVQLWPFSTTPYAHEEVRENRVQLGYQQYSLPIGWKKLTIYEAEERLQQLTMQQAIEQGKLFARQDVLKQAGEEAEIKDEKVLHAKAENGKVYLSIHYAVIEDIAAEQPIVALPPAPQQHDSNHSQ